MSYPAVLKSFKKHKVFLISTHVHPDADALTSALAVGLYLKSIGKTVHILNEDPVPDWLAFLPQTRLFKTPGQIKKINYDAAIVVDCGDIDRLGSVKSLFQPGRPIVNIDHHVTNTYFGTVNLVTPAASSTAEILYLLLKRAKCVFNRDIAMLLYAGILTDTGSFRYDSTSHHTHRIVSELLKFKFSVNELYNKLYEGVLLKDLKLFSAVVHQSKMCFQSKVAVVELRKEVLKKFSGAFDLKDKLFTFLRSVKGLEVIVIFTEVEKDQTRVNLRSQGRVDVAKLAARYGGGGHQKASGCMIAGDIPTAQRILLKEIKKVFAWKA